MYVCMYACMHVYIIIYIYVCIHIHTLLLTHMMKHSCVKKTSLVCLHYGLGRKQATARSTCPLRHDLFCAPYLQQLGTRS